MKKRGLLKKLGAWFLTLVLASGVLLTGMTAQAETGSPAMNEPAGGAADIVLVLDVSGSMEDPFGSEDTTKRIDGLKTAVAALAVNNLSDHDCAIIADGGNLCFGYRMEGQKIVVYTD